MVESLELVGHGGDPLRAELALPVGACEQSPVAGVLVVHEVFGLDEFTRRIQARLVEAGFAALAPDLYSRSGVPGPGSTPEEPAPEWEPEVIRAAAASIVDRRCVADLEAGLARLGSHPAVDAGRLGVVGFCLGGRLAFLLGCHSHRLSAVVDYYGRIVLPELSAAQPTQPLELVLNLEAPLLAHFGGLDDSIPLEHVEELRRRLDAFARPAEVHIYPGAAHGFANSLRRSWVPLAEEQAWQRTRDFLAEALGE